MSRRNIDLCWLRYKNVTNKFHIVGEISKLQAPECHLDARRWRWRASKACDIVPCGVCIYMYIGMHGCAVCRHAYICITR